MPRTQEPPQPLERQNRALSGPFLPTSFPFLVAGTPPWGPDACLDALGPRLATASRRPATGPRTRHDVRGGTEPGPPNSLLTPSAHCSTANWRRRGLAPVGSPAFHSDSRRSAVVRRGHGQVGRAGNSDLSCLRRPESLPGLPPPAPASSANGQREADVGSGVPPSVAERPSAADTSIPRRRRQRRREARRCRNAVSPGPSAVGRGVATSGGAAGGGSERLLRWVALECKSPVSKHATRVSNGAWIGVGQHAREGHKTPWPRAGGPKGNRSATGLGGAHALSQALSRSRLPQNAGTPVAGRPDLRIKRQSARRRKAQAHRLLYNVIIPCGAPAADHNGSLRSRCQSVHRTI